MSRSRVVLVVVIFAALLSPGTSSQAASSLLCSGYSACERAGYSDGGYEAKQKYSYWRMYTGTNCTNYVAYRLITTNGMPNTRPKSGVGNARDWGVAMASVTDKTPVVGSVAWWGKPSGGNHVAYVERVVSSSEIVVSESNWGRDFDWRRITKSGSGWPDGFIHFADQVIKNTAKPSLNSDPVVDAPLTASGGTWSPTGNDYAYVWSLDGSTISGATTRTYTPKASQLGKGLSVKVTATRTGAPPVSATSEAVEIGRGTLEQLTPPTISGNARVEETLTATPGTWSPTHQYTNWQWAADGVDIPKATKATLELTPELAGRRITVSPGVSRNSYHRSTATSAPTAAVAPGTFTSSGTARVEGIPRVDGTLTATSPTWSRDDVEVSHSWLVGGKAVPGATGPTYSPRGEDLGRTVQVRITASRSGYAPVSVTSPATTAVASTDFASRAAPTVTGTPRVGAQLTARVAPWSPEAEMSYQWYADGAAISGATAATFVPTEKQLGTQVHVAVWGRRTGYETRSARSAAVGPVDRPDLTISREPSLPGPALLNTPITVDTGDVSPGVGIAVQWLRNDVAISGARSTRFTPRSAQLGARLAARVTYTLAGHAPVVRTLRAGGTVRSTSTFVLASRVDQRTAAFSFTVKAAGVPSPTGTVRVVLRGKTHNVTLGKGGKATLKVKGMPKGASKATITYLGTTRTTTVTRERTLTAR